MNKSYTKEEVQIIAKSLLGRTFREIGGIEDEGQSFLQNKGSLGHVVEESGFHYDVNSNSEPDFKDAGIELKTTPYKKNKNGTLSAKERLVLNIINYMDEYNKTFHTSSFWIKNKSIQIIWYLYEENKEKSDLKLTHELLFSFPEDDLEIIKNDWETIIKKIKAGKAHEISEADTMYLAACTKGANAKTVRKQPFSQILAKQRAYSLKTTYMTQLVRLNIGNEKIEKIPLSTSTKLKHLSFEESLIEELKVYFGMNVKELAENYNVNLKSKSANSQLVASMLGIKGKVNNTDEFIKANIVLKTIRIEQSGKIIQSMSFPAFKYKEIVNEEWEDSQLREYFETTKFMFAIFENDGKDYIFKRIKFWNMPVVDLDTEVFKVWNNTKDIIKDGNIVKSVLNDKRKTNFLGARKTKILHVRPHGRNSKDTFPLPVKDKLTGAIEYTKYCFWLNNSYVKKII